MKDIFFILWYFLPAGLANTAPIFASHLPYVKSLNFPIDFGKKFRGKRILGDHKTIRGLIAGIIVGIIVVWLEVTIFNTSAGVRSFVPVDYRHIHIVWLGFLAGFGALLGDSIKSFFKRQLAIPSGKAWFPFDQIDYIIGGCLLMAIVLPLSFFDYLLLFILWFILHPISTSIGYFLKLKKQPI